MPSIQSHSAAERGSDRQSLTYHYYTVRPNRNTLSNDKIRHWVQAQLPDDGAILYACCGETPIGYDGPVTRVDIDESVPADIHADIRDLDEICEPASFDAIVFDPPFSAEQAVTTYDGITPGYGSTVTDIFDTLLRDCGRVIQIGFHTNAMPPGQGYRRDALAYFNLLGRQKDWFGVVDVHTDSPADSPRVNADPGRTAVPLNGGAGTRTEAGSTESLTMEYRVLQECPDTPLDSAAVASHVGTLATGRVLDTHAASVTGETLSDLQERTDEVFVNYGDDRGTGLGAFTSLSDEQDTDHTTRVTAQSLDTYYNVPMDTVLYSPAETAFQRTTNGGDTGADTAAKDAIHKLVKPGGQVIQVATARGTCMPGRLGYCRDHVAVFATPGDDDAIVVTVDIRPAGDSPDTQYEHTSYWVPCKHCGEGLPATPRVFTTSCLECGATPDQYCAFPDGSHGYHDSRIERVEQRHPLNQPCQGQDHPDATHEIAAEHTICLLPR